MRGVLKNGALPYIFRNCDIANLDNARPIVLLITILAAEIPGTANLIRHIWLTQPKTQPACPYTPRIIRWPDGRRDICGKRNAVVCDPDKE